MVANNREGKCVFCGKVYWHSSCKILFQDASAICFQCFEIKKDEAIQMVRNTIDED